MTTTDSDDLLQGAEALIDARRYTEALRIAQHLAGAEPANPIVHVVACRALLGLDCPTDAYTAATAAASLAPLWAVPHRLVSISLRHSPGGKSEPYIHYAVAAAREAVRLEPSEPASHIVLAEACADAKQLDAADQAARTALRLAPSSPNAWVAASFVAIKARNWIAAEHAARRALLLEPNSYAATNNLGVAIRRQGNWSLSAVAFHEAAKIDPRSPTARSNVEGVGFMYLAALCPLILLPLLIFWPVFVAARIGLSRWLLSRPERLKPLAQRVGTRLARSNRLRRKLDRRNEKAQRQLVRAGASGEWSALKGRHRLSSAFLATIAFAMGFIGFIFLAAVPDVAANGSRIASAVIGIILVGVAIVAARVLVRRRRGT